MQKLSHIASQQELSSSKLQIAPAKRYTKQKLVGRGAYGLVYKGLDTTTNTPLAIKIMNLENNSESLFDIQREISLLSQIKSPSIAAYLGCFIIEKKLWILMEYAEGGSINRLIKAGPIGEQQTSAIMHGVLLALEYLHRYGIMHRDIKAANILLNAKGVVQLCDFGVARQTFLLESSSKSYSFVGTPYWMAPEVISKEREYTFKADIWSLGITAYEIVMGNPPLAEHDPKHALMLILKNEPPKIPYEKSSRDLQEFVSQCLEINPEKRPSAKELLNSNRFIKKYISNKSQVNLTRLIDRYNEWETKNIEVLEKEFAGVVELSDNELENDPGWFFTLKDLSDSNSSNSQYHNLKPFISPNSAITSKEYRTDSGNDNINSIKSLENDNQHKSVTADNAQNETNSLSLSKNSINNMTVNVFKNNITANNQNESSTKTICKSSNLLSSKKNSESQLEILGENGLKNQNIKQKLIQKQNLTQASAKIVNQNTNVSQTKNKNISPIFIDSSFKADTHSSFQKSIKESEISNKIRTSNFGFKSNSLIHSNLPKNQYSVTDSISKDKKAAVLKDASFSKNAYPEELYPLQLNSTSKFFMNFFKEPKSKTSNNTHKLSIDSQLASGKDAFLKKSFEIKLDDFDKNTKFTTMSVFPEGRNDLGYQTQPIDTSTKNNIMQTSSPGFDSAALKFKRVAGSVKKKLLGKKEYDIIRNYEKQKKKEALFFNKFNSQSNTNSPFSRISKSNNLKKSLSTVVFSMPPKDYKKDAFLNDILFKNNASFQSKPRNTSQTNPQNIFSALPTKSMPVLNNSKPSFLSFAKKIETYDKTVDSLSPALPNSNNPAFFKNSIHNSYDRESARNSALPTLSSKAVKEAFTKKNYTVDDLSADNVIDNSSYAYKNDSYFTKSSTPHAAFSNQPKKRYPPVKINTNNIIKDEYNRNVSTPEYQMNPYPDAFTKDRPGEFNNNFSRPYSTNISGLASISNIFIPISPLEQQYNWSKKNYANERSVSYNGGAFRENKNFTLVTRSSNTNVNQTGSLFNIKTKFSPKNSSKNSSKNYTKSTNDFYQKDQIQRLSESSDQSEGSSMGSESITASNQSFPTKSHNITKSADTSLNCEKIVVASNSSPYLLTSGVIEDKAPCTIYTPTNNDDNTDFEMQLGSIKESIFTVLSQIEAEILQH
ncbi:hypothetical protein BB561_001524 [Smittium simulii]|uniref:non-specific serine/threonine protein kinase n=1 Tax=Smittium simulii TaxID=133385 RepID=A0A2T9YU49_9FUNG|nr:hypothetical protein BB561_001524 [Smittium simulii]